MKRLILSVLSLCLVVSCGCSLIESKPVEQRSFKASDLIYRMYGYSKDAATFRGTAFKVTYRGKIFLMSAAHVCEAITDKLLIELAKDHLVTSKILAQKPEYDICIMQLPVSLRGNQDVIQFSNTELKLNDTLRVHGFPNGSFKILIESKYLGKMRERVAPWVSPSADLGIIDYFAIPGQSGGPVLNQQNKLVGILIAGEIDGGRSLFIPLWAIIAYLDTLIVTPN